MTEQATDQPDSTAAVVDALRAHTSETCFACGPRNPIGLRVDDFRLDGDDVSATFLARPDYRGTEDSLHGGVAATALDEILVWAGILQERVLTVTAKMEVRYHRPVHPGGRRLGLQARVTERRGKRLLMSGELLDVDGERSVSASGLYLVSHDVADLIGG